MTETTCCEPMVSEEKLSEILNLYERGLYIQALTAAEECGPLKEWTGAAERVMAGRLAMNLGAPRLAHALHFLAHREFPEDPQALYYYGLMILDRRGPLAARRLAQKLGELPYAPDDLRSDWFAFKARLAAELRDFDSAEEWLDRAETLQPESAWIHVERSISLQQEDRYEDALAAAWRALDLRPWYRPAVQSAGHLLQLLERDHDALDLLLQAKERMECGSVAAQLAALQTELGQYEEARRSYDEYERLTPLMEDEIGKWLAGRRADAAYYCDDIPTAIQYARESDHPFHKRVAEHLENAAPDAKRVILPVGFVRQHHMTCSPATLSALSRFWSKTADHLELAEKICYDGTQALSERRWAAENGWLAREFVVSWDSAVQLIDRGIPFTLTTVEIGSAHLQAVIGYDSRRRTLLIRDPYQRNFGEFLAEEMIERYESTGPRGMVMVPQEKASLLDGIELPCVEHYERTNNFRGALQDHDRDAAYAIYEEMVANDPDGRLTLEAQRALAYYDSDQSASLEATEKLLEKFPKDGNLLISKLASLREMGRRDERMEILEQQADFKSDPYFWQIYAQELSADGREFEKASDLLRRAVRCQRGEARNYSLLADLLWAQRRFADALDLYRIALCLDDKNESYATAFFIASRHFKQGTKAIELLRRRFERLGAQSGWPARTLFTALAQLERQSEAFEVLEDALRRRPEDPDLLLFGADWHGRFGRFERAGELLAQAETRSQRTAWLRVAAGIASYRGEFREAESLWRRVAEFEPLNTDAHSAVASMLAETEGEAAALEYSRALIERFPYNYDLRRALVDRLWEEHPDEAETEVRLLIINHPADVWAHCQLAGLLGRRRNYREALLQAQTAISIDGSNPTCHGIHGQLLARNGDVPAAKESLRKAVRLSVDSEYAINQLMALCVTAEERREALEFVKAELDRQVIFGDGLLAYRNHAQEVLHPQELLKVLKEALKSRPDLWHAWSATVNQLTDMNRVEKARELAEGATKRFPLLPRTWLDLASVARMQGDQKAELEALQHALEISPGWGYASRELAAVYERGGDLVRCREILEQAVARSPLDSHNHGYLARCLWKLDEKEAAVERIEHTLFLDPDFESGWEWLAVWGPELGRPDQAEKMARDLTERRSGEVRSWLILARVLAAPENLDERLHAIDKAIELNPRHGEAHDLRAETLANEGRFDEALESCSPPAFADHPPTELRGRAAWIEAQRGNMSLAIQSMQDVVRDDPNYFWGWFRLADWYRASGENEAYLKAMEPLSRLAPQNPMVLGYLGEARTLNGDRAGAASAYARAFEIAPTYTFAGYSLFDMQVEENQFDDAETTLEVLHRHEGGEFVLAREVQLAARRQQAERAIEVFRELCTGGTEEWPINAAVDAIRKSGWDDVLDNVLGEVVATADCRPEVGRFWIECAAMKKNWKECEARVTTLSANEKVQARAISAYLEALAEAQQKRRVLKFLRENRQVVSKSTGAWGSAGYALITVNAVDECQKWMADWHKRDGVEPWMLLNLTTALQSRGLHKESLVVSRGALQFEPDGTTQLHRLWVSLETLLEKADTDTAEWVKQLDAAPLDAFYTVLHHIAMSIAVMVGNGTSFARARAQLRAAVKVVPELQKNTTLWKAYRRGVRRVAELKGGFGGWLWGWYRRWVV